jgi:NitT/TauT family transport system permease protein
MSMAETAPASATVSRPSRTLSLRDAGRVLAPWLFILGIFLIWEIVVGVAGIPSFVLPPPSAIFAAGWEYSDMILESAAQTMMTTLIGFAGAVAFGVFVGVAVGSSPLVYNGVYPALIGFNSIPKVAVVPILVIWFGVGTIPAIITAFLISFFPILVNVATGLATVEPELRDVLRALGASKIQIITKVGLPRAMPYFFASLKVAITLAFVGSITAETIASSKGIGYLMLVASSRFEVPLAFAGLLITALMGVAMYSISAIIERRMTGWATRGMEGEQITPAG